MAEKITPFNPIEMLHSDSEIAELLAEAYQDDEPAVFVSVIGQVVKHKGVAKMAELNLRRPTQESLISVYP